MAFLTVISEVPSMNIAQARLNVDFPDKYRAINGVALWFQKLRGGFFGGGGSVGSGGGTLRTNLATARATTVVTCAFASVTLDATSFTIGATTFTVATTPALSTDIANGASNAALATNLAAAINAHAVTSLFCKAAVSGDTCVITCFFPGVVGNQIPLAETNAGFTITAAFMATGASDEVDEFGFGYAIP